MVTIDKMEPKLISVTVSDDTDTAET